MDNRTNRLIIIVPKYYRSDINRMGKPVEIVEKELESVQQLNVNNSNDVVFGYN